MHTLERYNLIFVNKTKLDYCWKERWKVWVSIRTKLNSKLGLNSTRMTLTRHFRMRARWLERGGEGGTGESCERNFFIVFMYHIYNFAMKKLIYSSECSHRRVFVDVSRKNSLSSSNSDDFYAIWIKISWIFVINCWECSLHFFIWLERHFTFSRHFHIIMHFQAMLGRCLLLILHFSNIWENRTHSFVSQNWFKVMEEWWEEKKMKKSKPQKPILSIHNDHHHRHHHHRPSTNF